MLICPICKNETNKEGVDFPFCSKRCKHIDLGLWVSDAYKIAAPTEGSEQAAPVDLGE